MPVMNNMKGFDSSNPLKKITKYLGRINPTPTSHTKSLIRDKVGAVLLYAHRKPCLVDAHLTGQTKNNKIGRAQFIVPLHLNLIFFHAILDTQYELLFTID